MKSAVDRCLVPASGHCGRSLPRAIEYQVESLDFQLVFVQVGYSNSELDPLENDCHQLEMQVTRSINTLTIYL